jgi:DNA-binding HxlR family transcriptional regulator
MPINQPEPGDLDMIEGTRSVLEMLAGRWSVDLMYLLASGTRRYNQIFYEVGEISKKTLTQTLRALELKGLVARRVYHEVPLRVEYSLTPRGWRMTSLLMSMYEWSVEQESQPAPTHLRLVPPAAEQRQAA